MSQAPTTSVTPPRVSVFMPLHNCAAFVSPAIDSIMAQSLSGLELVIVENGSLDASREIARRAAAADARIRVIERDAALGVSGAANLGVAAARADVVARMDQDDLSAPTRLERQLEVLDRDPGAVAVASLGRGIDDRGRPVRPPDRWQLLRRSALPPFPHGSVMFRRNAFERAGGYRPEAGHWEDVDLFLRMAQLGKVLIVPDPLYAYRYHGSSASSQLRLDVTEDTLVQMWGCVEARRASGSYEHLLLHGRTAPRAEDLSRAQLHRDGQRLWAGLPPGPVPAARDWPYRNRRGRLTCALVGLRTRWHAWNPASLRLVLRTAIGARGLAARVVLLRTSTIEWKPSR